MRLKSSKLINKMFIGLMLIAMFASAAGCSGSSKTKPTLGSEPAKVETLAGKETDKATKEETKAEGTKPAESASNTTVSGELKVHFINVGQADSILVQQGNSNMLVDAGNNGDAESIKNYLDSQGISALDVVVGTHAHEDHIGSLGYIINSFKVGKVYFPKQTSTTKTFQDFTNAIKSKRLKLTEPSVGSTLNIGDATATILAPNGTGYEDANDYSVVIKIAYGNTSFLLTGDAEAVSEKEMLSKGLDLSATVLKVGHHGSRSSSGESFLNKVNPKYAVISVGKDNSYGHPTQEVMDRLKTRSIPVYRTDESGTIVAISNGSSITFSTQPGSYKGIVSQTSASNSGSSSGSTVATQPASAPAAEPKPALTPAPTPEPASGEKVYWLTTGTSKSYHKDINCQYIRNKTTKSGTIKEATADKHSDPCNKCAI